MSEARNFFEMEIEREVQKRLSEAKQELERKQDAELQSYLNNPKKMIQLYQERVKELESVIEDYRDGYEFSVTVQQSEDWMDMSAAVKALGYKNWGRNNTYKLLKKEGVLRYNKEPYQRYVDSGHFKTVEQYFDFPDGETGINRKTVVSQKGLDLIRKLINEVDTETRLEHE